MRRWVLRWWAWQIATASASLGLLETRFGLVPDLGGTVRLPGLVGQARAKKMMWLAQRLDGKTAGDIGLVEEVVGDDDTDEDAFASDGAQRLLSIRIGTRRRSAAQFRLSRQADIDTLLELLLRLRVMSADPSAAGTRGPRRRKYSRAASRGRASTGAT